MSTSARTTESLDASSHEEPSRRQLRRSNRSLVVPWLVVARSGKTMLRAIFLCTLLGVTSAFQAGRLTTSTAGSSHLSTSQRRLARASISATTKLKATIISCTKYATSGQPQPSIRAQRILMDKQVQAPSLLPSPAGAPSSSSSPPLTGVEPRPRPRVPSRRHLRHDRGDRAVRRPGPGQIQRQR